MRFTLKNPTKVALQKQVKDIVGSEVLRVVLKQLVPDIDQLTKQRE